MTKTGERYTAARRQLVTKAAAETPPSPETPVPTETPSTSTEAPVGASTDTPSPEEPRVSDETVAARTGRTRDEWFTLLGAWGAADRPHREIARWLTDEHRVDGWWAQELTVSYEKAIGRRRLGQRPDGFSVTATKTVAVPVERFFAAFVDDDVRARWLPGVSLTLRTAAPHRTARFDWEDGPSRLVIGFTSKGDERSSVAMEISRLPDPEAAQRAKTFWRERLQELQRVLET